MTESNYNKNKILGFLNIILIAVILILAAYLILRYFGLDKAIYIITCIVPIVGVLYWITKKTYKNIHTGNIIFTWPMFIILLLVFLGEILITIFGIKTDNINNQEVSNDLPQVVNENACKWIESKAQKWAESFDLLFLKSYDSLRNVLSFRVGLESGVAVSAQLDFCISKRIEKDAKIDSYIDEYVKSGCDVSNFHIKRKLPIKVRNICKRQDRDFGPHYKGVILDTL